MKKAALLLVAVLLLVAPAFSRGGQEGQAAQKKSVSVLAVWGGQELEAFNQMVAPFTQKSGIKIDYEGTRDIDAILTTRVQAGNPPDVAGLPGPGKMAELARAGNLVDLATVLDMNEVKKNYAQGWLDMATVDGKLTGLFMKTSIKGLVFYNVKAVAANNVPLPKTWDEMMTVSKAIAAKGVTPWAIGIESGAASGWVGTDWLENIFLRLHGPQKYKDWYEGKLAWTSTEVKQAWEMWGQLVADPKMCYGGKQYILSTNFGQAPRPLFTEPPQAFFHQQATFIQSFITEMFPNLKPITDFNFFAFPSINAQYTKAIEAGGDLFGLFGKDEASKEFVRYLASTDAQTTWVKLTGSLSANRQVPTTAYPDQMTQNSAEILKGAEMVVFDASDMMPGQMNTAFWTGVVNFVENPASLDKILAELDRVRGEAYAKK